MTYDSKGTVILFIEQTWTQSKINYKIRQTRILTLFSVRCYLFTNGKTLFKKLQFTASLSLPVLVGMNNLYVTNMFNFIQIWLA